jgi:hypothetical protein
MFQKEKKQSMFCFDPSHLQTQKKTKTKKRDIFLYGDLLLFFTKKQNFTNVQKRIKKKYLKKVTKLYSVLPPPPHGPTRGSGDAPQGRTPKKPRGKFFFEFFSQGPT